MLCTCLLPPCYVCCQAAQTGWGACEQGGTHATVCCMLKALFGAGECGRSWSGVGHANFGWPHFGVVRVTYRECARSKALE